MEQLCEARVKDDNWTGLSDATERRKRQNRLHQRAWRRKKAAQHTSSDQHLLKEPANEPRRSVNRSRPDVDGSPTREVVELLTVHPYIPSHFHRKLKPFSYWERLEAQLRLLGSAGRESEHSYPSLSKDSSLTYDTISNPRHHTRIIPPMIPYLNGNDRPGPTISNVTFPLSADHRLLVLIQYNVLRALMTNMSILSILSRIPLECGAALNIKDLPSPPESIPPSLESTQLQKRIRHDAWIDIVPWSNMRDNFLLNRGKYDEDDLCVDMVGGLYEGFDEVQTRGLIVWGEPWSETGWEVSKGFATKWSFLLKGCDALVESTNRWRESRGEERLVIDV
ncbi:hypothetical protein F4677DRAFT_445683 [Hypoxylon crocopeplum]|nr:hypothetical protein F4677DRAFT_445683 [Hypoxylon crocopeplum]